MSTVVIGICVAMLGVGLLLLLARMTIGPTVLDRTVSFDVMVAFAIIGICLHAAVVRSTDSLVLLVVLTLVGFIGSVTVARFIDPTSVDDDGEEQPAGDGRDAEGEALDDSPVEGVARGEMR